MENFRSTLKIELVYRTSWRTRDEAEIFEYGWYNTRRIQKELGYLSPEQPAAGIRVDDDLRAHSISTGSTLTLDSLGP